MYKKFSTQCKYAIVYVYIVRKLYITIAIRSARYDKLQDGKDELSCEILNSQSGAVKGQSCIFFFFSILIDTVLINLNVFALSIVQAQFLIEAKRSYLPLY